MLEDLRKNQKWIIMTTAILFVVGMGLMGITQILQKKPYVGEIAGEKIHYKDFYKSFQANYRNYVSQNPDQEVDANIEKRLLDQTWNQYVARILFDNAIKDMKIKVTDEDVLDELKNNPPEYVKTSERFQKDGKFDKEAYLDFLANDEQGIALQLVAQIESQLPYQKLEEKIKGEVQVTEEDARQDYIDENLKVNATLARYDQSKIDSVFISDKEIKDKYEEDKKEKYERGPARKLKYIKLNLEASEADLDAVKKEIFAIKDQLDNGADFAEIAKKESQDGSAAKGGDLGFFGRGRMVKPFEDTAFGMEIGEISEPVKTRFGWHIIKLVDKRTEDGKEEVKASHILKKTEPSEKTKQEFANNVEDIELMLEEKDLTEIADELNLEIEETPEFYEDSRYIAGIGQKEDLVDFAFAADVGDVATPIKNSDKEYIFAEVSYKVGTHYLPFEEVEGRIRRALEREKKNEKAIEIAKAFFNKNKGDNLLDLAKKEDWTISEIEDINAKKSIPKVGKVEEINEALLAKKTGEMTDLIETDKGAFFAKITARTEADMTKFEEDKETFISTLQTEKENEHYNEWYQELKDNSDIEDNRKEYFDF